MASRQQHARSESGLYDAAVAKLRDDLRQIDGDIVVNLQSWEAHVRLVGQREAMIRALEALKDAYTEQYGSPGGAEPEEDDDE